MNIYIAIILIILGTSLSSCSLDDGLNSPDYENIDHVDIPLSFTLDSENINKTRVFDFQKHDENGLFYNKLDLADYSLILIYDGQIVNEISLSNFPQKNGGEPSFHFNGLNVLQYSFKDNVLSFTLSLPKYWDPSKTYICCYARDNTSFCTKIMIDYLMDDYADGRQTFGGRFRLSEVNDWSKITTKFTIKRIYTEINVLCEFDWLDFGKEGKDYAIVEQVCTLNWETGLSSFDIGKAREEYYRYSFCDILTNKCFIFKNFQSNYYFTKHYSESSTIADIKTVYNGKTYYMLNPISFFTTTDPSLPIIGVPEFFDEKTDSNTGKEIKYISCILYNKWNAYSFNISIPKEGFQANKRYVYLVKNNIFTKTGQFDENGDLIFTRASIEANQNVLTSDDFELIVTDLDEPFLN